MSNRGALANLDDDAAIDAISSGVLLKELAAKYGVHKSSMHERLSKHPRYPQAVCDQSESMVENALADVMAVAPSIPDIARVRARFDAAFKYAAARDPARWGNKGADTGIAIQVVINTGLSTNNPQVEVVGLPNKQADLDHTP